jgi:hypothetical protein
MERRELFPILAAATVAPLDAQHQHHRPALVSTDRYQLQVFSAEQNRILDELAEILIPADAASGGARAARVSQYFDLMAAHLAGFRQDFEQGLRDLDALAQERFAAPLASLDTARLTELLRIASANEGAPRTGAERFFELLKFQTVEGYRQSHIGQTEWLGYKPHPPGLYPDRTVD